MIVFPNEFLSVILKKKYFSEKWMNKTHVHFCIYFRRVFLLRINQKNKLVSLSLRWSIRVFNC